MSYELVQRIGQGGRRWRQPEVFTVDVHVVQGADGAVRRWVAFFAPARREAGAGDTTTLSGRSVEELFSSVMDHVEETMDALQRPVGVLWTYEGDVDQWSTIYESHELERLEPGQMSSRPIRPDDLD